MDFLVIFGRTIVRNTVQTYSKIPPNIVRKFVRQFPKHSPKIIQNYSKKFQNIKTDQIVSYFCQTKSKTYKYHQTIIQKNVNGYVILHYITIDYITLRSRLQLRVHLHSRLHLHSNLHVQHLANAYVYIYVYIYITFALHTKSYGTLH